MVTNAHADSDKECFTDCNKMSPAGRLKTHVDKWREATNSIYICSIIENGYKLPLKKVPHSIFLRNNKYCFNEHEFCSGGNRRA